MPFKSPGQIVQRWRQQGLRNGFHHFRRRGLQLQGQRFFTSSSDQLQSATLFFDLLPPARHLALAATSSSANTSFTLARIRRSAAESASPRPLPPPPFSVTSPASAAIEGIGHPTEVRVEGVHGEGARARTRSGHRSRSCRARPVRCLVIEKPTPPPRNMYSPRKTKPNTVGNQTKAMAVQPKVRPTGATTCPSRMRTPPRKLHSTMLNAARPNHV